METESKVVNEILAEVEKYTGERPGTVHIEDTYEDSIRLTHKRYGGPNNEAEERYIAGLRERHDEVEKRKFEHLEAEEVEELPDDYVETLEVLEDAPVSEVEYVDQLVADTILNNKNAFYSKDGIIIRK